MPGLTGQPLLIMVEAARPLSRATNAAAVVAAGIQKLNMSHTPNTNVWTKPQDPAALVRAPSAKQQAASAKHQAPSNKRQATS